MKVKLRRCIDQVGTNSNFLESTSGGFKPLGYLITQNVDDKLVIEFRNKSEFCVKFLIFLILIQNLLQMRFFQIVIFVAETAGHFRAFVFCEH